MNTTSKISKGLLVLATTGSVLFTSGCATSFTGSAYVEEGRSGCEVKCKGQGMTMVGMVFMGEYSDACVCSAREHATSKVEDAVASVAAGTGVVMQMRRQEEQANRANATN